jgi:hypothetical protein
MTKKIIYVTLINLLIIFLIFTVLEITWRAFFPEFRNCSSAQNVSHGKMVFQSKFMGINIRVPYDGYAVKIKNGVPLMLILGDSISYGYGTPYEDIYWRKFERLYNFTSNSGIQVLSFSGFGNRLSDSVDMMDLALSNNNKLVVKYIMYQFNFNDITPYNQTALKKRRHLRWLGGHLQWLEQSDLFLKVMAFKEHYLLGSVFYSFMNHYAQLIKYRRHGTCVERGIDALGAYSWTYGSKPFKLLSEQLWEDFYRSLVKLKGYSDKQNAKLIIFVSPLLYDIDTKGIHPFMNNNLDFRCATISPRERLFAIANELNIDIIDPKDFLKEAFEDRLKEGNFEPFFFNGDDNHFTPIASSYIAEYLYQYFVTH